MCGFTEFSSCCYGEPKYQVQKHVEPRLISFNEKTNNTWIYVTCEGLIELFKSVFKEAQYEQCMGLYWGLNLQTD